MKIIYKDETKLIIDEKPTFLLALCFFYFTFLFSFLIYFHSISPEYFLDESVHFTIFLMMTFGIVLSIVWCRFTSVIIDKKNNGVIKTTTCFRKTELFFDINNIESVIVKFCLQITPMTAAGTQKTFYLGLFLRGKDKQDIMLNPLSGLITFNSSTQEDREKFFSLSQEVANFLNVQLISEAPKDQKAFSELISNMTMRYRAERFK